MSYIKFEQPQAIEHLVFQVKPERFEEWLALDHELWTLAEAQLCPGLLRKEVWVNQNVPGEVHCVIYWRNYADWMSISPQWLEANERKFAEHFGPNEVKCVRADHTDGIACYKISEFNNSAGT